MLVMLSALGAMRGGSLRTPPRSARAPRSRPLVMRRSKTGVWVEHEGSLDWLKTAIQRQELLDRASEISITEDVRELNEWRELRDELASSLGRHPTQARDASAAPASISVGVARRSSSDHARCI